MCLLGPPNKFLPSYIQTSATATEKNLFLCFDLHTVLLRINFMVEKMWYNKRKYGIKPLCLLTGIAKGD
jgi:hypothetical protein